MERKSFPVSQVKALDGEADAPGTFEAIVAVFGNVDHYGDRVEPGAFTETLKSGYPPVVWAHQWTEPPIGVTLEASETDEGLLIKGRLLIDENERAREVYAAMKANGGDNQPALREFSFAYDIVNAGWEVEDEDEVFSLKQLDLIEVGPCLKGVNDETRLIAVKGDAPADGRVRPPKPSAKSQAEIDADREKQNDELQAAADAQQATTDSAAKWRDIQTRRPDPLVA